MKIVLASRNAHKIGELQTLLSQYIKDIEILSLDDVGIFDEIEENGSTYLENALIKARTVFKATGIATMADDSGLCVDALGGEPGVQSARFMGEDTSYTIKNAAIIEKLAGVPDSVIAKAKTYLRELEQEGAAPNVEKAAPADQISLLDLGADEVRDTLRRLDPNNMTPMEAMLALMELKKKVEM